MTTHWPMNRFHMMMCDKRSGLGHHAFWFEPASFLTTPWILFLIEIWRFIVNRWQCYGEFFRTLQWVFMMIIHSFTHSQELTLCEQMFIMPTNLCHFKSILLFVLPNVWCVQNAWKDSTQVPLCFPVPRCIAGLVPQQKPQVPHCHPLLSLLSPAAFQCSWEMSIHRMLSVFLLLWSTSGRQRHCGLPPKVTTISNLIPQTLCRFAQAVEHDRTRGTGNEVINPVKYKSWILV